MAGSLNQTSLELTPLMIVNGAIEVLKDKENWTQHYFAKDGLDTMCSPISGEACKFCVIGSMRKVAGQDYGAVLRVLPVIYKILGTQHLAAWNDDPNRKFEEVVDLLLKTKKELENV